MQQRFAGLVVVILLLSLTGCAADGDGAATATGGPSANPVTASASPMATAEVLDQQQAELALLTVEDLNDTYSEDTNEEDDNTDDLGCLDALEPRDGAVSAERTFSDDFFSYALSSVASFESEAAADEHFNEVRRGLEGCTEITIPVDEEDDARLDLTVGQGPVTEAEDQVQVDATTTSDAPIALNISLWSGRVDNNVAITGLVYAGASTDLDNDALAVRAYAKLAAVTAGEPIPPSEAAAAAAARELAFGDTYTSDTTGNMLTISTPQPFEPSDTAVAEQGRGVVLEVKAENASAEPLNAYDFSFSATCGGVGAPMVYDSEQGLDGGTPPGDILPGRSSTWRLAFTIPRPDPCELIVTLNFGLGDGVYWVGEA